MVEITHLVVSLIALIPVLGMALKEKWFVKRSTVNTNGITMIIVGLSSFYFHTTKLVYDIPVGLLLIGYGVLIIALINKNWEWAQKLGNSKIVLVILVLNALLQVGMISL